MNATAKKPKAQCVKTSNVVQLFPKKRGRRGTLSHEQRLVEMLQRYIATVQSGRIFDLSIVACLNSGEVIRDSVEKEASLSVR